MCLIDLSAFVFVIQYTTVMCNGYLSHLSREKEILLQIADVAMETAAAVPAALRELERGVL